MELYHGSTYIVDAPNLERLNNKTDFGKGFYTTTNIEQAKKWVEIKKKRLIQKGFHENIKGYINIYEYNENKNFKILNFEF